MLRRSFNQVKSLARVNNSFLSATTRPLYTNHYEKYGKKEPMEVD
jgi:hypothetical protein